MCHPPPLRLARAQVGMAVAPETKAVGVAASDKASVTPTPERKARDSAIAAALDAVLLKDIQRIVVAYDKRPGQTPHLHERHHSPRSSLSACAVVLCGVQECGGVRCRNGCRRE